MLSVNKYCMQTISAVKLEVILPCALLSSIKQSARADTTQASCLSPKICRILRGVLKFETL